MLKICVEKWDKNKDKLREVITQSKDHNSWEYKDIVRMTFSVIFNDDEEMLDINKITEIDDSDYQGTLLYLIPFDLYQPGPQDYLMTFVDYGSCSGCDTLQAIQGWHSNILPTEQQVNDYMALCKDIIANTIKPYNYGWRNDPKFDVVKYTDNGSTP